MRRDWRRGRRIPPPGSPSARYNKSVQLDASHCWKALAARDPRFDGVFFTGVRSTGVFCRPICPARTPKRDHCQFFPTAGAALRAGFRPCLRCRPETAPGTPAWRGAAASVTRALRLIEEGALDRGSVGALAKRLGLSERRLRDLFRDHLGASPAGVAQARRLLAAKKLLDETDLPAAEVAAAAGFGSARRFREVFSGAYGRPPSARRGAPDHPLTLTLSYRPPYDWPAMLWFLAPRSIAGMEGVEDGAYWRTIRVDEDAGRITVRPSGEGRTLLVELELPSLRRLATVAARLRRLFDLDAEPRVIQQGLGALAAARPGLRIPGAWDAFEMTIRAILEQQVTAKGAATLAGRLVAAAGPEFAVGGRLFPTPDEVLAADLGVVGLTGARRCAILAAAEAFANGRIPVDADFVTVRQALTELPGVGPWTAEYVAMRALGDPDAWPPNDLGLRRRFGGDAKELDRQAEQWRPWRAYAAMHLWTPEEL